MEDKNTPSLPSWSSNTDNKEEKKDERVLVEGNTVYISKDVKYPMTSKTYRR